MNPLRILTLFLLSTSVAMAAGGPDEGFPAFQLVAHGVNLLFLVGLIAWFAGPAIKDALANRATNTRRELEEAAAGKQQAQARYEELEARLSGFEQELARLRAEAEQNVQREVEAIHSRAERDAQLIGESARRSINDEVARARQALRKDAVDLAVEVATKQVQAEIGQADHDRLGQEFLGAVKAEQEEVSHG